MGIKVGVCGTGVFAQCFIPLIKAHPLVDKVILCDLAPEKLSASAARYGIAETCPSLDKLVQTDVDAIAIFTQHDRHAPQAVQALRAGKHVYSAVPSAITLREIEDLVQAVEDTGLIYMIGETSYYYPCAIYCRERFRKGDMGYAVYGEGEYHHDWSHGMENVVRNRFGADWMKHVTMPPFFYPTHSTSMIISVTGAHVTRVCGMGVKHQVKPGETDFTSVPGRVYKNDFWNEVMLCQMSDGSTARFGEFRRVGYSWRPGSVGMSLYGSEGSFEQNMRQMIWTGKTGESYEDVTEKLTCKSRAKEEAKELAEARKGGLGHEAFTSVSSVHPVHLLPREYVGHSNGHEGSHQFLMHEWVTACVNKVQPPNNVWQAARYLVPGLIAHESAMRGGELMEVPDFGDGPK